MKSTIACVLLLLLSNFVFAQDYPMKPNEEHSRLMTNVGVWDAEISMMTPDGKTASTGVENVKKLGELWTVSDFEYEFMGAPVQGHGTMGYDPQTKKYIGTWVESGSPFISTLEGEYDDEKKAIVYKMMGKDPAGNDAEYRIITATQDATHRSFELHAKIGEDEYMKVLEINYAKRDDK